MSLLYFQFVRRITTTEFFTFPPLAPWNKLKTSHETLPNLGGLPSHLIYFIYTTKSCFECSVQSLLASLQHYTPFFTMLSNSFLICVLFISFSIWCWRLETTTAHETHSTYSASFQTCCHMLFYRLSFSILRKDKGTSMSWQGMQSEGCRWLQCVQTYLHSFSSPRSSM